MKKKNKKQLQRERPIYEDIRWRFLMQLVLLALVTLMLSEIFMYDELLKGAGPDTIEMAELALSMFIMFDLLLVVRYVPKKIEFLKSNWMKAILILPTWVMVKPFLVLGLDQLFPVIASQNNIIQASRGINFFDNIRDFIEKL